LPTVNFNLFKIFPFANEKGGDRKKLSLGLAQDDKHHDYTIDGDRFDHTYDDEHS
jgi:hypothetical protein